MRPHRRSATICNDALSEGCRFMPAADERLYVATSLGDALAALADRGHSGAPLAGATWIMRAPLREERQELSYVALTKIEELRQVDILDSEIRIGACVTHAELAQSLASLPECGALVQAAARSANPAIRGVATVGGNLCTAAFPAADLVPALICLEAEVEIATPRACERTSLEHFLAHRTNLEPGRFVRRVIVPRNANRSAHLRLPLRKAGDYPVAIVSMAVALGADGLVSSARVAVGSVEPVARRWRRLEQDLIGRPLDSAWAADKAASYCADFQGRDGVEAPGWYRVKVLPNLVRRAVDAIREQQ
jgi:aerobic carbon-monoxide dehydrogenase medium subunit